MRGSDMLIKDIPNDHAEKLISAIGDLRPEMIVRVVARIMRFISLVSSSMFLVR